ncbi:MAG: DNA glycosylase [Candidatus Eisenbacteria bacterium]
MTGLITGRIHAADLDLETSMGCGQIFGWDRRGQVYFGMIGPVAVGIQQEGDRIGFVSESSLDRSRIISYLGLDVDLGEILKSITRDPFMKRVVDSVRGLRLLKQDPWPCLCSYIISANNRVERIDTIVKQISRELGTRHVVDGEEVYRLPGPEVLAGCAESGLRSCGTGFRAPYLLSAAAMVSDGTIDFDAIDGMPTAEARDLLKIIPGVGDKIADCVLLFAFSRYETFPVDVWIKRAVQIKYFDSEEVKAEEIRRFGREYFGEYAGYAQEYIYHYAREYGLE